MFVPDFFIIGAQKCGTTMLYHYLKEHPCVFLPELKEPHFFCTDLPGLNAVGGENEYNELYNRVPYGCLTGDASASYFFSSQAISNILERNSDARFVLMLRNPIEMIQAYHSELCYNLSEDVLDFKKAWRLQLERKEGRSIPSSCNEPRKLIYTDVASLGDQLERFFNVVPEEQRLVIFHDDVKNDLKGVYADVLDFLGVDIVIPDQFEKINERKRIRNRTLAHLHRRVPSFLGPLYLPIKSLLNFLGVSPSGLLEKYNTAKTQGVPIEPDFLFELERVLTPQIRKIESLSGRDLTHWINKS